MSNELVALDTSGKASVISYNLPEPTSYSGRVTLGLDIPPGYYKPVPPTVIPQFDLDGVTKAMKNGFDNQDMFAGLGVRVGELKYVDATQRYLRLTRVLLWNVSSSIVGSTTYGGVPVQDTTTIIPYRAVPYEGIVSYTSDTNRINFTPAYNLSYDAQLANNIGGASDQSLSDVPDPLRPGRLIRVRAMGGVYPSGAYLIGAAYEVKVTQSSVINNGQYMSSTTESTPVLLDSLLTDSVLGLTPANVLANLNAGNRLRITRDMNNKMIATWAPLSLTPRLGIMLRYRLSTFHGSYGAGRVVKTFSLLPGEKTNITIKSYLRTTESRKETSSILDSFTQESADDFSQALTHENADRAERKESSSWHVEAQAESDWGFVAVQVGAGAKGGSNQAGEQFAKNMTNAVSKHASLASSKRDIKIDQSVETTTSTGEETGVQRILQNINTGRTLNFVFRQLNQEFISILHLVDAQLGYQNGVPGGLKRYTLAEIDTMLDDAIGPGSEAGKPWRQIVKERIVNELSYIIDHTGVPVKLIEEKTLLDGANNVVKDAQGRPVTFYRARTDITTPYTSQSGKQFTVPGIIMAVSSNVMRTSGLIAEPLLGQGEGLDPYSLALQTQANRRQQIQNDLQKARTSHDTMLTGILTAQDTAAAQIYAQVYPRALPAPPK